ncbi:MAG: MATE family efflux transporter, partial [Clostridia bacterium]|nr:MATE family efflux transporter [Clostridia bacterium]
FFNVFGDYFFVFTLDLGIMGAGLATALGAVISLAVMCTHFLKKSNTLRLVKPDKLFSKLRFISVTGFSTFFIDVAMGILTVLFNRQILKYLGGDALSVYGIIINISTFVQCCAYSIGQASQPMISVNYGAQYGGRIKQVLKYALGTAAAFGLFWTAINLIAPNMFVRIFMTPTENILTIAPGIIRCYSVSYLLLPFNIFSTYYFQALMKPTASFVVSVARGAVISGTLIMLLPVIAGGASIWLAMPITELIVAVYVSAGMIKYTKALPTKEDRS